MSTWRSAVGRSLDGQVLEIGPGSVPFPTAPTATVTFADRPLDGTRDEAFPELIGTPKGPDADIPIDLDAEGLRDVADDTYDVVVASHVIEHLAAPVAALQEMHRVLRPGGRLVLLVPDRTVTFDALRRPTPLAHLLDEHRAGVRTLSDEHIREFHLSTTAEPRVPPDEQDGIEIGPDIIAFHRRRTIHVHCWTPEEFAAGLVGLTDAGLIAWRLTDLTLVDDEPGNEFGFVLVKEDPADGTPRARAGRLVDDWSRLLLAVPGRDPGRLGAFTAALHRDLAPDAGDLVAGPVARLAAAPTDTQLAARLAAAEHRVDALERSRAYLAGRIMTAPLRAARSGSRR